MYELYEKITNIKDAQCAENKDGRKISHHTISRSGATGSQDHPDGATKIQLSSKVAKFPG